MEHLLFPVALFGSQDEFGRPINVGLDEFGFPAGASVITVEAGVSSFSLSNKAISARVYMQAVGQHVSIAVSTACQVTNVEWLVRSNAACSLAVAADPAKGRVDYEARTDGSSLSVSSPCPVVIREWMIRPSAVCEIGLETNPVISRVEYVAWAEALQLALQSQDTISKVSYHASLATAAACELASSPATGQHSHIAGADVCGLSLDTHDALGYLAWIAAAGGSGMAMAAQSAQPFVRWHADAGEPALAMLAPRSRSFVDDRAMEPYGLLMCDAAGTPIAFVIPKSVEYEKLPNAAGKVKICLSFDHPAAADLHKFTEGYLYRCGVLWQGIVPDKRSIGGEDLLLECLTFEELLARWRLPRDWTYGVGSLSNNMRRIVEERYDTYTKSNIDDYTEADKVNCYLDSDVGAKFKVRMGQYAGGITSAASVAFTWSFTEPKDLYKLRFRMRTLTASRLITLNFKVSYDGATWGDWSGDTEFNGLAAGTHELDDLMGGYGFGQVMGIQVKVSTPSVSGYSYVYLEGIEMITKGASGYTLTHSVEASDYMPGLYRFDNVTAMDALASICSDSGYSMRVTPAKSVVVERAGGAAPWVLAVGADEMCGGAEVLEAGTSGESMIANQLLIRGFGEGTGALAIHRRDDASATLYGARAAIATNPMITDTTLQRSIADGMLAELAWPRPDIRVRVPVPERKGRATVPWAGLVKAGDAVAVCWPGGVAYGEGAVGPGEWFYVTEERRSWKTGEGEAVELRLARKPAAQDRAVAVTQIPVPVDAETTAVRITLGSTRR